MLKNKTNYKVEYTFYKLKKGLKKIKKENINLFFKQKFINKYIKNDCIKQSFNYGLNDVICLKNNFFFSNVSNKYYIQKIQSFEFFIDFLNLKNLNNKYNLLFMQINNRLYYINLQNLNYFINLKKNYILILNFFNNLKKQIIKKFIFKKYFYFLKFKFFFFKFYFKKKINNLV